MPTRCCRPASLLDRRQILALAAIALSACGTAMTFVVLSLQLQQARDWSQMQTSAAFVPFTVALIASGRAPDGSSAGTGPELSQAAALGTGAGELALLALTGIDAYISYGYGLLPGLVPLPSSTAASFAGAAVLATEGVPQQQTRLTGNVLNTTMEFGPRSWSRACSRSAVTPGRSPRRGPAWPS
jgi:hypothetical protein